MADRPAPRALLIVGPHAASAAVFARMAQRLGAELAAGAGAPRGGDVAVLHERLLASLGAEGRGRARGAGRDALRRPEVLALRDALAARVRGPLAAAPLWAIEDPRLGRALPLWRALLAELEVPVACLLVGGGPGELVEVLGGGADAAPGPEVVPWLERALAAEEGSRGMSRAFATREQLLADWRATADGIAASLGLVWPRPVEEAAPEMEALVAAERPAPVAREGPLRALSALPARAAAVHREIARAAESGEGPALAQQLAAARRALEAARPVVVEAVDSASAAAQGDAAVEAELARARAQLAEVQAAAVSLRAALEASYLEVRTLYASMSWRVTRPLRALFDFGSGLPAFAREMRGFPRRARYTLATRGLSALRSDVTSELGGRLRRGTLAASPPSRAHTSAAALAPDVPRLPLHLPTPVAPRATLVIPAFNAFRHTYACLASLLQAGGEPSFEVVVADDGSHDETREIEHMAPGVRVVRSPENRGFIDACNRGAAVARGEYLVFLNNDTQVSPGWLERLLEPFEEEEVGLVGAKLVYPDGRLQEAGGILFSDGSGWNYGRGDDPADPRYEFRCDAHYCSGACIAIPRALFQELGGFDTLYHPMYYEDVDLAFAVRAAGRRVVYQPACVVVHAEGGTAGTDTGSGAKRYQVANREKLLAKWEAELARQPPPASDPDVARHQPGGPHVLVIDSYTPRPDQDAGSLRMVNVFSLLQRLGCRVSFLPENRAHDGDYTRALQAAGVEALYHPYLPSLEQHLKQRGARYDAVLMSRVEVAAQVIDAVRRHCPRARRLFDTVDLHFLREGRRARLEPAAAARAERLKEQELAVARACDVTLVVSRAEQELLAREAPELRVEVLSLVHRPEPTDTPFAERSGVLFIGNFQHPPNVDAMSWFLREVHPLLRQRLPGVPFEVIGANAPKSLTRLAEDGVRFLGHVPDIRPRFAAARLSVAPLRYGAGVKGKISSSLALGVPVVTTPLGAEGMDLVHGEHALIAEGAEAFAEAVATLHSDPELWGRLAEAGLGAVALQFSHERAEQALARALELPLSGVGT